MLERINAHPKDAHITFDEEPHVYYIHGDSNGWTSVTTFVHHYFSDFNPYFAAKAMVRSRKFPDGDPKYARYIPYVYDEDTGARRNNEAIVKSILEKWENDGDVARTLGTYLHKAIEDYYNQAPLPEPLPSDWQFFKQFDEEL